MPMATLAARLVEAENAYHSLMLGQGVAEFRDQNGETVRYSKADVAALRGYIAALKQQIADELAGTLPSEGPMRPFFL